MKISYSYFVFCVSYAPHQFILKIILSIAHEFRIVLTGILKRLADFIFLAMYTVCERHLLISLTTVFLSRNTLLLFAVLQQKIKGSIFFGENLVYKTEILHVSCTIILLFISDCPFYMPLNISNFKSRTKTETTFTLVLRIPMFLLTNTCEIKWNELFQSFTIAYAKVYFSSLN